MQISAPIRLLKSGIFTLVLPLLVLSGLACTNADLKLLEGVLGEVDSVNGQVTIVTADGRTVTLTIDTETLVETEQGSAALEALVPGADIAITLNENGEVVRKIKAHLAKVEGNIVKIDAGQITIQGKHGELVTLTVNEGTRIELEDDFPGSLADLQVGMEAEVRYNPENSVALRVETEKEDTEIKGAIIHVADDKITIATKQGRQVTLIVGPGTRIDWDGQGPDGLDRLAEGLKVKAKFDSFTLRASKLEVEEDAAEAKVEGRLVEVSAEQITVRTDQGVELTLEVNNATRIKLHDEQRTLQDLPVGQIVEIKYNPITKVAIRVEVED